MKDKQGRKWPAKQSLSLATVFRMALMVTMSFMVEA